jgi:hypothetical protein
MDSMRNSGEPLPDIQIALEPLKERRLASRRARTAFGVASVLAWLMLVLLSALAGCRDVATIWSSESRSPDGRWIATARTEQYGGPGTAGVLSTVFLEQVYGRRDKIQVLQLSQDAASVELKLNWLAPTHLEITYKQPASVDFQAIKCGGIDISVRDVSNAPNNALVSQ